VSAHRYTKVTVPTNMQHTCWAVNVAVQCAVHACSCTNTQHSMQPTAAGSPKRHKLPTPKPQPQACRQRACAFLPGSPSVLLLPLCHGCPMLPASSSCQLDNHVGATLAPEVLLMSTGVLATDGSIKHSSLQAAHHKASNHNRASHKVSMWSLLAPAHPATCI
jgi:hypothetical protein